MNSKLILSLLSLLCLGTTIRVGGYDVSGKVFGIEQEITKKEWKSLLEEDYAEHWEVFIGVPHAMVSDLSSVDPMSDGKNGKPLGLNYDPKNVFCVEKHGEELLLHVSGEIFGAWTTKQEYENYHLKLQFRWGEQIWPPRLDRPRDSGLLYHCVGEHGKFWNVWMESLEFQIQEGDLGDFYALAGTEIDIPALQDVGEEEFNYNPTADLYTFSSIEKEAPVHCNKGLDNENPHGEWNTLELICIGDKAWHIVNGKVVMVLHNSRHLSKTGEIEPLTKGKIQIQSEAAEVYYKNIKIKKLGRSVSIEKYMNH